MRLIKKYLLFEKHTCPWWLAYAWDHRLRKLIHNGRQILKPYLSAGDRVADLGCGMGFFSIAMAEYVGPAGRVYAVDLQQAMLDILSQRFQKRNPRLPIQTILVGRENHIPVPLDFMLSFWMLHEVDNQAAFLSNWYSRLKEGGKFLLVEPRIHTSRKLFDEEVSLCEHLGFELLSLPLVRISRAALFRKHIENPRDEA